jgi:hypothetical protein
MIDLRLLTVGERSGDGTKTRRKYVKSLIAVDMSKIERVGTPLSDEEVLQVFNLGEWRDTAPPPGVVYADAVLAIVRGIGDGVAGATFVARWLADMGGDYWRGLLVVVDFGIEAPDRVAADYLNAIEAQLHGQPVLVNFCRPGHVNGMQYVMLSKMMTQCREAEPP